MPATPANLALYASEGLLLLVGLVLLWRFGLRREARSVRPALPEWPTSVQDFFLALLIIIIGGLAGQFAATLLLGPMHLSADTTLILANAAFQGGLLLAVALVPLGFGKFALRGDTIRTALGGGAATFLLSLPLVTGVNVVWVLLLQRFGVDAEQQELLRLFEHAESRFLLGLLIVLATIVAPIGEELIFRGVIFRYLRTRAPRWLALLLPALIFASLHVNWKTLDGLASFAPLVTFAVILSLAYERTGRISTSIVAHALFNLHSVLLLFSGIAG